MMVYPIACVTRNDDALYHSMSSILSLFKFFTLCRTVRSENRRCQCVFYGRDGKRLCRNLYFKIVQPWLLPRGFHVRIMCVFLISAMRTACLPVPIAHRLKAEIKEHLE